MSNHLVKAKKKIVSYEDYLKTLETGLGYKLYALQLENAMIENKLATVEMLVDIYNACRKDAERKIKEKQNG